MGERSGGRGVKQSTLMTGMPRLRVYRREGPKGSSRRAICCRLPAEAINEFHRRADVRDDHGAGVLTSA